ncbi:protein unc-13 homolog [Macadamia integrifolia]|uniref:protein unc-13 homolog n=1 Tax=Macadamia integrifolia TaxID=60698 RepID=UPI001C4EE4C9|nr:protein unc-13 homolog [Macadamia integrifolia]
MSHFFKDRSLGESKRDMGGNGIILPVPDLPSPFGEFRGNLSDSEFRETAYEIFVSASRPSGGKPLTFIPQSEKNERSPSSSLLSYASSLSPSSTSPSLQRSLTSTAASNFKKALGLRSSKKSPGKESSPSKSKKPATVGELMRAQMGVSEQADSRIRRGLLRIAAGQVGRRIESMVLPLELLQQFKSSDFTDQQEYEAWQTRNLKVLEAGLLLHPHLPIGKSDTGSQRLRQIISGASERPIETGKNNESMQFLRSTVMSLACRSFDGSATDTCHWADGYPFNVRLYQMLLEACFDTNEGTTVIEEVDEVIELIKKTWVMLGMNQMLHNLCFCWVLFHRYITTGQVENDLLLAANNQLVEVTKDAKSTKDPVYSKVLSPTLSSILGWSEKRLLAYHDTFNRTNIESMENIVSLGVTSAKILVEDISHEYRRKRREEVDVARNRVDTYIRSSLRTAFAQRMEKADSSRRSNPLPVLCILAKDIGELAANEKEVFSPILKKFHPFAAGVAVATLHVCYGNELKQFVSGITELTPDAVQVLGAADKLEKDLVQIAVEDSVDSEDGGKAIIREMPPFEADTAIANLVKAWIKTRVDTMKAWVDSNLQKEVWNPRVNKENIAPSAVEVLRTVNENLDGFFQLPIPVHPALLPDLMTGMDRCLQHYITKAKSGCGTRNTFAPSMPALTRCTMGSKKSKKKEKSQGTQRRKSQVGTMNGDSSLGIPQLCVRINTLLHIWTELDVLENRIVTHLRNCASAHADDFANGLGKKFDLAAAACREGIQQLSEATAYKIIFHDLSHVLWDGLYVGEPASSRIEPLLTELEKNLGIIAETVHNRVRTLLITEVMKASFDGFSLVLLAGGPSRAFSQQDAQIIEDDFKSLKDLFWSNGDGLSSDVIEKSSKTVGDVLPLFRANSQSLIDNFKRRTLDTYGLSKSRFPLPPTSGQWDRDEPNTLLRVLCYRDDEAATKFLKKTYNLPKKL